MTCYEREDDTSYLISFLVDSRILLKDENEPSMKALQEAMIQSCVEVAVRENEEDGAEFSKIMLDVTQV